MKKLFIIITAMAVMLPLAACTSFIISGKATPDGRPIIFKNRDTGTLSNASIVVQGSRFRFVAIINAKELSARNVWAGHNEAGFAIINTDASNLNDPKEPQEWDGIMMRRALGKCATLKDFETLLDTLPRPLRVNSNFGVLDAQGGCAYYETSNRGYTKYDANDPMQAPNGYILRTNFAYTGDPQRGGGFERFAAIKEFMAKAQADGNLKADYLITNAPRYLKHGLTHTDLRQMMPATASDTTYVAFRDFIPRSSTASAILVQGVKAGEDASLTTSWICMGWPLITVAMPVMLHCNTALPNVITPIHNGESWLSTKCLDLKKRIYNLHKGSVADYIDLAQLINKAGTGLNQRIQPIEAEVISRGNTMLRKLRKHPANSQPLDAYYRWLEQYITEQYNNL